jgi:multimeric flavodoxin WrbA
MSDRRTFIKQAALIAAALAAKPLAGRTVPPAKPVGNVLKTTDNQKTMKVLLLNGSPHSKGNTATALGEIARTLEAEGIESEIVWLGTKPVRGCIACGRCRGAGRCVFNDDICNEISEKMEKADALIVGSPVYYGQPNGALMAVIQRMFYSNGSAVSGKPAAALAVCRRGSATAAFQTLNMPFMMMNMQVVTSQYWNIAYGQSEGQAALDAEGMQTMRTLAHNMAWALRQNGGKPAPGRPSGDPGAFTNFIR